MSRQGDTQTLVESFCTLADEVQNLIDRKTILEHKLRFAAEQYQQLADKYAPTAPEIAETLANLQVPPDEHKLSIPSSYVPLPKRGQQTGCNQHQIALLIRDGRRAAQQLSVRSNNRNDRYEPNNRSENGDRNDANGNGSGGSSKETSSGTAITTMSIIMEQDFTVEGKKGVLDCPFSAMKRQQQLLRQQQQLEQENQQLHITGGGDDVQNVDDHDGADTADLVAAAPVGGMTSNAGAGNSSVHMDDPICAALAEESTSQRAPSTTGGNGAPRCPIRFLDQHSPEEVAHYVETHKHQLPRSHAICLRRYNKNEQQIRKMDAKYGNLVNMISGLGQFHQPMLASADPAAAGAESGGASGGAGGVILGVGDRDEEEVVDRAKLHKDSHERVKTWANGVSASGEDAEGDDGNNNGGADDDQDGKGAPLRGRRRSMESSGSGGDNTEPERESHFDRPLKEVRLGESPSRPWGIAVPISSISRDAAAQPPLSPPAAPVRMPSPNRAPVRSPPVSPSKPQQPVRKCPFDHSKFGLGIALPPGHAPIEEGEDREAQGNTVEAEAAETTPRLDGDGVKTPQPEPLFTPTKPQMSQPPPPQTKAQPQQQPQQTFSQPAFVNFPQQTAAYAGAAAGAPAGTIPQMVFTGPVFIGYPMEQAAQFLQMYNNPQRQ
ncbi:hypothetical protein SEUCBS139899_003794 [Sporothrix eucalyptigena]|uniref:Uncharacterized protein n=1 Tax=Sporothrix eucalyptigena TaxID=1812306 RepID=A0ABP0BEX3_9PEZI